MEPTHFAMRKSRLIPIKGTPLFLLVACILFAGCSLKQKDPGLNDPIRARMEEDRKAAFLDAKRTEKNHLNLARELTAKGYYDVALVQLQEAEKHEGHNPEVHHLMGVCYREMKEHETAEKRFKKALSLDPDYAPAHDGLGVLYEMSGRREEARGAFLKAVRINPARPDFLSNLGFLEMRAGRLKQAATCFEKSLRISPDYRPALDNLAICYGLQGRDKDAFSLLKKHYPPAEVFNNMGVICRLRGEDRRAAILFERALKSDAGFEPARENLARLRVKKDQKEVKP